MASTPHAHRCASWRELTNNRSVTNNCGTLEIFDKAGDTSPALYMYGCWDDYQLTRTIDRAASGSIAATAAAASTTGSSPPSAKSSSASKSGGGGGSRPGVVAAAAAVGVLALLVIAGLVAYILRLRSSRAAPATPTELRKVAGAGPSAPGSVWDVAGGAGKPELPGGANAWEMGGREIHRMPAARRRRRRARRGAYDPAAGSVKYPGSRGTASPAPSWAPQTPAQPHSFLEMEGSGGPRGGAALPGGTERVRCLSRHPAAQV